MSAELSKQEPQSVARPLRILVPLIKQDLTDATEASERAGMPYYRAAGEKLLEARDGSFEGRTAEFYDWAQRTFGKGQKSVRTYIALVLTETKGRRRTFTSLQDFESARAGRDLSARIRPRDWHTGVSDTVERARREAERIRDDSLTRQQEREAEQKLALRLIDIGWKVLAKELHPDKGGSRDVMARLNRVRDRLKQHA